MFELLLPILGLVVGVVLAIMFKHPLNGIYAQYAAVGSWAGLDSVCGGIRGGLEGKFRTDIFISGFISNVLIASFLAWLGDLIGLDLFLAVALVLGARLFTNLSLIRRMIMTKWQDAKERQRLERLAESMTSGANAGETAS